MGAGGREAREAAVCRVAVCRVALPYFGFCRSPCMDSGLPVFTLEEVLASWVGELPIVQKTDAEPKFVLLCLQNGPHPRLSDWSLLGPRLQASRFGTLLQKQPGKLRQICTAGSPELGVLGVCRRTFRWRGASKGLCWCIMKLGVGKTSTFTCLGSASK